MRSISSKLIGISSRLWRRKKAPKSAYFLDISTYIPVITLLTFLSVNTTMRLALYQPDIAQNAASLIRLGACLGVGVDIIEPCGFLFTEAGFRRAGMDYLEMAEVSRHSSWEAYLAARGAGRIVLLTTKASEPYTSFAFDAGDT